MTPFLSRLALLLTGLFALWLIAARPPGAGSDCALPCWHGMRAGVTSRAAAVALLQPLGWKGITDCSTDPNCDRFVWEDPDRPERNALVFVGKDQIYMITLAEPEFALGDVWQVMGKPERIIYDMRYDPTVRRVSAFYLSLLFGAQGVSLQASVACPSDFGGLLHASLNSMDLWAGTDRVQAGGTIAELRRAFSEVCSY